MSDTDLIQSIRSTLLYYDIFAYPLTCDEIFSFLGVNSITPDTIRERIDEEIRSGRLHEHNGFVSIDSRIQSLVERRLRMERYAQKHWRIARLMMHVIKRAPFVRSVIVTGTLSKNISDSTQDIDYFIITIPGRLWIARTLLIAFKKVFLLNSRKFFCLNYFISTDDLEIPEKNIFTATEIAHAKVLYNEQLFHAFLAANGWMRSFFPNWAHGAIHSLPVNNRPSLVARILEMPFRGSIGDTIDDKLMHVWERIWRKRYPHLSEEKRNFLFRVSKSSSKAHAPDFQTKILNAYTLRLNARHPETLPRLEELRA